MKTKFEKQNFSDAALDTDRYIKMFADLGFKAGNIEISLTNGCSAYINIFAEVINEGSMHNCCFIYDGKCCLQVRVSDHSSNLETICGGAVGNKISFEMFEKLAINGVIING